jgi:hypothetical protein
MQIIENADSGSVGDISRDFWVSEAATGLQLFTTFLLI